MQKVKLSDINYFDIGEMNISDDFMTSATADDWKKLKTSEAYNFFVSKLQQKENCIFLTWAGTSKSSWWLLMKDLWAHFTNPFLYSSEFNAKLTELKYTEDNIEELLSRYETSIIYKKNNGELTTEDEEFKEKIITELKEQCKIEFSFDKSEHLSLLDALNYLRWKEKARLKIFTLNYDTLFEQAANAGNYVVIDWFSFNIERRFNGTNFDLDIVDRKNNRMEEKTLFRKVFHLYKLHGSLDWKKDWKNGYIKCPEDAEGAWEIIYPGNSKYEQSYNMPYFEMLTRFQSELRKENVLLNIVWYKFGDHHINRMIQEALSNNSSLTINILWWDLWEKIEDELALRNEFLSELKPYIENTRISLFKMRFWWFVRLISVNAPIMTEEEKLAKAISDYQKQ